MHVDTLKFYKYKPVKKPKYQGKFCWFPFEIIQIDEDGDVMLCGCQQYMPYVVGNIYQQKLEDIWLGIEANTVRQSVVDGDFTYCNWSCGMLPILPERPAQLPSVSSFPLKIKIDLDRSCNLKCPSCRENVIIEKHGKKIDKQIELYNEIVSWAKNNPDKSVNVIPVSSGEIFASHSGLKFLQSLTDHPYNNIQIKLVTNGTLLNKNQQLIKDIRHLISDISISIDAATPETYANVRGGDWSELMAGLQLVKDLNFSKLTFNFCIQKNNWHEIELFGDFALSFNAKVSYQKLQNWGHWNADWWHDNNVFDRTRNTFELAIESLRRIVKKYPRHISTGELTNYLQRTESP